MSPLDHRPVMDPLLSELDNAVSAPDSRDICKGVKAALEHALSAGHDFLPSQYTRAVEQGYARHLLHRDPQQRYSVVMMVWDKGQGTPLHDHGGHWCVECVYQGQIEVVSYDLYEERRDHCVRFAERSRITSNIGGAGALIPPYEYHTIRNTRKEIAVTMHVYEGEIETCNIFEPLDEPGWFKRICKELRYS